MLELIEIFKYLELSLPNLNCWVISMFLMTIKMFISKNLVLKYYYHLFY